MAQAPPVAPPAKKKSVDVKMEGSDAEAPPRGPGGQGPGAMGVQGQGTEWGASKGVREA